MAFPGETYGEGRFDRDKAFTLYNSAGDVDEVGVLPPLERLVSLNGMALGDCLGKSAAIAKGDQWGFTLVKKGGDQCVYVGTPAEAANGNGGTRIEGVVSVAIWVGRQIRVGRGPFMRSDWVGRQIPMMWTFPWVTGMPTRRSRKQTVTRTATRIPWWWF